MKFTQMAKANEIERSWVVVDAEGKVFGRIITEVATILRGKNKPCFTCKILPICGGGCSQISMENEGKEYCVKNFDENRKLQLVKNRFLNLVSTQ